MKKLIRKQLLKKYAVTALLSVLGLLYLYVGDVIFGYGMNNISNLTSYLFFTISEKLLGVILFIILLGPDLLHWITGHQPGRDAER
ncbi:hypothetical protein [Paenibacillus wynnii]|uniref:Uncharacterized protein n=1 Tax=Paenibacillus wynnii TaxID=268407 RepID=A0A098M3V0_9BACL|nr:hypothetical protein [Paenibacillus wynnii]KGE16708.1 hypothetical protein PWYN_18590 [Paenibacillus wynnii]